jgi:hypothetical protein
MVRSITLAGKHTSLLIDEYYLSLIKKTGIMKSKFALCSGLILFVVIPNIHAQKKNEDFNEAIQNTAKAFHDLFHKKKDTTDSSSTNTTGNNVKNSNSQASGVVAKKNKPVGDIGKLAPNVKYIDADALLPFNHGAALVRKGSSTALIGPDGNFIVPYNTYQFLFEEKHGMSSKPMYVESGIFPAYNPSDGNKVFINSKGKVITPHTQNGDYRFTMDKRMLRHVFSSRGGPYGTIYITADGKKYTINGPEFGNIDDGIGRATNGSSNRMAYIKMDGTKITDYLYSQADAFSDGMALVGNADAFGQIKYGYINEQGKLVIPLTFSVKPGRFACGYAKVYPRDKSDFEYAFINKKGEIVFKQTLADVKKYGNFPDFFSYGLSINGGNVLTTDFKIISKADFFTSYGIPAESWLASGSGIPYQVEGETNPKLFFTTRFGIEPIFHTGGLIGFINLATKKVVMPSFSQLGLFDPVSHLAYAKAVIGKDNNGQAVKRRGYVNEQGEFVIVQGSGSKW